MKGSFLTSSQRRSLRQHLHQTEKAGLYRRILALLEVDLGRSVSEVARLLQVDRRSVQRWLRHFLAEGTPSSLERKPGQGRRPAWDQSLQTRLESALVQPPGQMGYAGTSWTVPLLRRALSSQQTLSSATIRRRLHALGYVWKRFRYVLAPDPEREKKTQNLPTNPGIACSKRAFGSG